MKNLRDEDKKALDEAVKAMHEKKAQAIELLKESGTPVSFQSSSNRFKFILDDIIIESDGEITKFEIEGHDIAPHIVHASVTFTSKDYPVVTVVFKPKASRINATS